MTLREQVAQTLETIRTHLQGHGGDVELVDVTDDGTVQVRLRGACKGCPMATQTMSMGIEQALRRQVPGVAAVVAVE